MSIINIMFIPPNRMAYGMLINRKKIRRFASCCKRTNHRVPNIYFRNSVGQTQEDLILKRKYPTILVIHGSMRLFGPLFDLPTIIIICFTVPKETDSNFPPPFPSHASSSSRNSWQSVLQWSSFCCLHINIPYYFYVHTQLLVLRRRAEADLQNEDGWTALMFAVYNR